MRHQGSKLRRCELELLGPVYDHARLEEDRRGVRAFEHHQLVEAINPEVRFDQFTIFPFDLFRVVARKLKSLVLERPGERDGKLCALRAMPVGVGNKHGVAFESVAVEILPPVIFPRAQIAVLDGVVVNRDEQIGWNPVRAIRPLLKVTLGAFRQHEGGEPRPTRGDC